MKNILEMIWGSRLLRTAFWALAGLVTLAALFYAVEGWRGARRLAEVKAFLKAEGEPLRFSDVRKPRFGQPGNFCEFPMLASLTDFTIDAETGELVHADPSSRDRLRSLRLPKGEDGADPPPLPGSDRAGPNALAAWATFLGRVAGVPEIDPAGPPAARVASALAADDAVFGELRTAARESEFAELPPQVRGTSLREMILAPMPHYSDLMPLSKWLTLRGVAAAAGGEAEIAMDCLRLKLLLAEATRGDPFLLGHLVGMAVAAGTEEIVRVGLESGTWSDDHLALLCETLGEVDFYRVGADAMRGEMTGFFANFTRLMKEGKVREFANLAVPGDAAEAGPWSSGVALCALPDGWVDQNTALGMELTFRHGIRPLRDRRLTVDGFDSLERNLGRTTPYNFLAKLALSSSGAVIERTGRVQFLMDGARVACALELAERRNGARPRTLGELVPNPLATLPGDPFGEGSLRHRDDDGGVRVIYSIGANGTDEGGVAGRSKSGKRDWAQGDWVFTWHAPPM